MCVDLMFLVPHLEGSQNKHSEIKLQETELVAFIELPLLYKLLF